MINNQLYLAITFATQKKEILKTEKLAPSPSRRGLGRGDKGKYMKKFLFLFLLLPFTLSAQLGGSLSFDFVNLPVNAKQLGLGAYNITASGQDVNMFLANPALLADSLEDRLSFSFQPYNADVNGTSLAYATEIKKAGVWGVAIQNISYGSFDLNDATGSNLGTFNANDLLIVISHARKFRHFAFGTNLKFAQSNIENYQSSGVLMDFGGAFIHPKRDLKVGVLVKNFGFALSSYTSTEDFEMPLDVQFGLSIKPEKMPLRFSLTAHHLNRLLDIAYEDPNLAGKVDALGNPVQEEIGFGDELSRHIVLGGELVFSKNFNFRLGYNFLRRRELALDSRLGTVGFSWGFMMRIKKFEFAFSRSAQFINEGINSFTLTLNTKDFFKKKRVIE